MFACVIGMYWKMFCALILGQLKDDVIDVIDVIVPVEGN